MMEPSKLIIKGSSIQDNRLIVDRSKIAEMKELTGMKAAKFRRMDNSSSNQIDNNDDDDVEINGLIWDEYDASIKLVNQNLWQIPSPLTIQYASRVRKLDLSYNCLQTLAGIEYFNCLEELVLDNNLLNDSIRFFYNPFMKCLSINKNKLTDLERFLNEITLKLPNLTYLSMLGNSACPDQLSSSEHDDKDYSRYRSYVIHRMPQLKFLDSTQIRRTERNDAQKRGQYYRLIRLNSDSVVETNKLRSHLFQFREQNDNNDDDRQNNPLPFTQDNGQPKGGFGKLKHRYTGKHSEGNRFIRNHEL
ncbi:hypothetical protein DERP_009284 [Dermatophagoides pteronyssinus]|uniref:Leucine-rich melanocyte differentiation-associated protein-like n=1 Tax=Dermatophagoides pteronyssinus TaxID=6956 RepID=A0ABQ8ITE8_DERPT|nr:hypothetical protein DERP_009284 [Dermatophagoides pteronyssinus]